MRKIVSVQTVADLTPIDGADRIEKARVLGWNVVVGKGAYTVGEKVAYFEIDAFLDGENPAFTEFLARGTRKFVVGGVEKAGHVLKTAKLRGVVSQGLILSLATLGFTDDEIAEIEVGSDITERVGVVKWEAPLPVGTNIVGKFDSRFAPKTDAIRLQNLANDFDVLKTVEWEPTLKVDGTSQTIANDGGTIRVFGRNWELDAETSGGLQAARQLGIVDALLEMGDSATVQAEFVGPGIQKNRLKLSANTLIVFAVWQNGEKVARSEWPTAMLNAATPVLGAEFAPQNFETPQDLIDFVDGLRGGYTKDVLDEGVVFHPVDPSNMPSALLEILDRNGNFKVISNKWLIKGGD